MKRKFNSDKLGIEEFSSPYITEITPDIKVKLYYGGGGDIKIRSSISGKEYYFKTGVPTEVDQKDAEEFLKMKKMSGCCGHSYEMNLFGKI